MTWPNRYHLVTAIYVNARGFAFVVFEGPLAPIDWSIVEVRGSDKRERILGRIDALLGRYRPNVLVVQKMGQSGSDRSQRIRRLNEAIIAMAKRYSLSVATISRDEVRQQFAYLGSTTKETIAAAIAKHIPAFERFLPLPRKPWKSEDARMGMFDAAALALTFFASATEMKWPDR